jgi:hypothetical protein
MDQHDVAVHWWFCDHPWLGGCTLVVLRPPVTWWLYTGGFATTRDLVAVHWWFGDYPWLGGCTWVVSRPPVTWWLYTGGLVTTRDLVAVHWWFRDHPWLGGCTEWQCISNLIVNRQPVFRTWDAITKAEKMDNKGLRFYVMRWAMRVPLQYW